MVAGTQAELDGIGLGATPQVVLAYAGIGTQDLLARVRTRALAQ